MTAQEPWEEAVIEAVDLGREVSADRARDKQISIISTVIGRADLSPCLTAAAARKIGTWPRNKPLTTGRPDLP
jgi:hypothetical protein